MIRTLNGMVLLVVFSAIPLLAQEKIEDLKSFYEGAQNDDEVSYKMTLQNGQEPAQLFSVKYKVEQARVVGIDITTERKYLKSVDPGARTVTTEFSRKETFKEQLQANYEKYGYTDITSPDGGLWGGPKIVGKKTIKIAGQDVECLQIESRFKAKLFKTEFHATEIYYYNKSVPVMKMAKMEGLYELVTASGRIKQSVTLEWMKKK